MTNTLYHGAPGVPDISSLLSRNNTDLLVAYPKGSRSGKMGITNNSLQNRWSVGYIAEGGSK